MILPSIFKVRKHLKMIEPHFSCLYTLMTGWHLLHSWNIFPKSILEVFHWPHATDVYADQLPLFVDSTLIDNQYKTHLDQRTYPCAVWSGCLYQIVFLNKQCNFWPGCKCASSSFLKYLHFHCESLNEPLHLRCGSYLHEQIDFSHTHIRAIWAG